MTVYSGSDIVVFNGIIIQYSTAVQIIAGNEVLRLATAQERACYAKRP